MKNATLVAISLGILALVPAVTPADVMTYNGMGLRDAVKVHAPGHLAHNLTVNAGQLCVTYLGEDYDAFCVDIDQHAGSGEVEEWTVYDLPQNGDLIAFLFETYADGVTTGVEAAALQVAIWEVLSETDDSFFDLTSGNFRIRKNDAAVTLATAYLSTVPDSYTPTVEPVVLHSETRRDVIISGGQVPEPASLSVVSLGAVLMLVRRRRRR